MFILKYTKSQELEADREVVYLFQFLFQTGSVIFKSHTAFNCKISYIKDFKPDFRIS